MAFNVCIFSFTDKGKELSEKISRIDGLFLRNERVSFFIERRNDVLKEAFQKYQGIIFIGATGIAVRKIAPFLQSKLTDPAVIVIDEKCKYIIPILSGHIVGANDLARCLAEALFAEAVITTATDVNGYKAIDEIAAENGLIIKESEGIKRINSKILKGETVKVYCSEYLEPVFDRLKIYEPASWQTADVIISSDKRVRGNREQLNIFYKRIVVGVGCRKDTDPAVFEKVVNDALSSVFVTPADVEIIASIDIKEKEAAIVKYAEKYGISFKVFNAIELSKVQGDFDESEFVKEVTGVSNISERAAVIAAYKGSFILKRKVDSGVTVSVFQQIKRIDFNGNA